MNRMTALVLLAALSACATPADEFKVTQLSDGRTEVAQPMSGANQVLDAMSMPVDQIVVAKAQRICPAGYTIEPQPTRKRAEYAYPERVWAIRCS